MTPFVLQSDDAAAGNRSEVNDLPPGRTEADAARHPRERGSGEAKATRIFILARRASGCDGRIAESAKPKDGIGRKDRLRGTCSEPFRPMIGADSAVAPRRGGERTATDAATSEARVIVTFG